MGANEPGRISKPKTPNLEGFDMQLKTTRWKTSSTPLVVSPPRVPVTTPDKAGTWSTGFTTGR